MYSTHSKHWRRRIRRRYSAISTQTYALQELARSTYPNVRKGLQLLNAASVQGRESQSLYNTMMQVIANSEYPDSQQVRRLLHQAKIQQLVDETTIKYALRAVCYDNENSIQDALDILDIAKHFCVVTTRHYNYVIHAMAHDRGHARVSVALELLHEARHSRHINSWTYANVFDVIAKSERPNIRLMMRLFHQARNEGHIDAMVYNNAIQVIAHAQEPDLFQAMDLFRSAKAYGICNAMVYCSVLDALAESVHVDKIAMGLNIFFELRAKNLIIFPVFHHYRIDLHGLSFGLAYFLLKHALKREVKAAPDGVAVSVIYGKGLHSQSIREGFHPLKRAVLMVVDEMTADMEFCEDEVNAGNGYFFYRKPRVLAYSQQSRHKTAEQKQTMAYLARERLGLFKREHHLEERLGLTKRAHKAIVS